MIIYLVPACRQCGAYIKTIVTIALACGRANRHLELFKSEENQPFSACGDKNMIHAYVNTPATAKLRVKENNR